jgi:hypothetical protein
MLKWMIAWGVVLLLVLVFLGAADSLDDGDDPDELQYHPPDEPSLSLRDISPRGPSQALRRQLPQRGSQGETGGEE